MELKDMIKQFNVLKQRYQRVRNLIKNRNSTLTQEQRIELEQERDDLYAEVEEIGEKINQKIKETSAS